MNAIHARDALCYSQAGTSGVDWVYAYDHDEPHGEVDIVWIYFGYDTPMAWIGAERNKVLTGDWHRLRDVFSNACAELVRIASPIAPSRTSDWTFWMRGAGGVMTVSVGLGARLDFQTVDERPCGGVTVGELVTSAMGIAAARDA